MLANDNEVLYKYRGGQLRGDYYHVDLTNKSVLGEFVELEPFARGAGVLAPYEVIAA